MSPAQYDGTEMSMTMTMTWNLQGRDGRISKLEHVYLRGSKIRFMILPDM